MSNAATLNKPEAPTKAKETNELNATHRCDSCNAAAFVKVGLKKSERLPEGGELYFCSHHFNKAEDALTPLTTSITDERHKLVENKLIGNVNS